MSAALATPLYPSQRPRGGWFKQHNQYFHLRAKLIRTLIQERILQIIERETIQTVEPVRTRFIPMEEFAAYCDCSVRAVQYGLSDLLGSGVIETLQKSAKGTSYRVAYEKWPELATQPAVAEESEPAEEEPEPPGPAVRIPVIDRWKKVSPGGRTKAVILPKQISSFRVLSIDGMYFRSQLVNDVLEVEFRGEEHAKPNPKSRGSEPMDTTGFDNFEAAWISRNINAGVNDWSEARRIWSQMDTPERLRAVEGVHARFEAGEYDPKDPKWIPLPQKYLANQSWMRPVRPRRAPQPEKQLDCLRPSMRRD